MMENLNSCQFNLNSVCLRFVFDKLMFKCNYFEYWCYLGVYLNCSRDRESLLPDLMPSSMWWRDTYCLDELFPTDSLPDLTNFIWSSLSCASNFWPIFLWMLWPLMNNSVRSVSFLDELRLFGTNNTTSALSVEDGEFWLLHLHHSEVEDQPGSHLWKLPSHTAPPQVGCRCLFQGTSRPILVFSLHFYKNIPHARWLCICLKCFSHIKVFVTQHIFLSIISSCLLPIPQNPIWLKA